MKALSLIGLLTGIIFSSAAQTTNVSFVSTLSGEDRIALAKTTIQLTEFHEKSFWVQYENYQNKSQELSSKIYGSLADLAAVSKTSEPKLAFDAARQMIFYRFEQLPLWQKYYAEIGSAHNGVIALQFLQTEILLDMLESARIYELTPLKEYRFHSREDSATRLPVDKHKVLAAALSLSANEQGTFFKVYGRYEHECNDILGENYGLIATYAADPSDYSPGQAQLLGFNLLEIMRRETKLKEKYFGEMNTAMGASLAARFLAWEDYYSLVSKMDAWSDAP